MPRFAAERIYIMIKLIIGVKGSGKTKTLIEMVHKALSETNGDVVCIVSDAESLYGFVAGILASNHDVSDLFIDSALKICKNDAAAFDEFLIKTDKLTAELGVKCLITSSLHPDDATETMKKYL